MELVSQSKKALHPVGMVEDFQKEVSRRVPTLMAGEVAGRQGKVQVWSPSSQQRLWKAVVYGVPLALSVAAVLAEVFPDFWLTLMTYQASWFFPAVFSLFQGADSIFAVLLCLCVPVLLALSRRCYVVTDEAGIGITTWSGSRSLRWSDVAGCYRGYGPWSMQLSLRSGGTVGVNLSGYSQSARNDLYSSICRHAHLSPVQPILFGLQSKDEPLPALGG